MNFTEKKTIFDSIPIRELDGVMWLGKIAPFVIIDGKRIVCWVEMFLPLESNHPQHVESYIDRMCAKICYQDSISTRQNMQDFNSLELDKNGVFKANMIGLYELIEGGFLSEGDCGEVYFIKAKYNPHPKSEYRGIWADSKGAAMKFIRPFIEDSDLLAKNEGYTPTPRPKWFI
jgi:hypothetical protein